MSEVTAEQLRESLRVWGSSDAMSAYAKDIKTAVKLLADRPLTLAALQAGAEERKVESFDKLMFEGREQIEMWADVVEKRMGRAGYVRELVKRFDELRELLGYWPDGFKGESTVVLVPRSE